MAKNGSSIYDDPGILNAVITSVENGAPFGDASLSAGLGESTVRNWLLRAKEKDAPEELVTAATLILKAEADNIVKCTKIILAATAKDWKAAQAWVKMRRPKEFAELTRNELTGADGAPLGDLKGTLSEEEIKELAAAFVKETRAD